MLKNYWPALLGPAHLGSSPCHFFQKLHGLLLPLDRRLEPRDVLDLVLRARLMSPGIARGTPTLAEPGETGEKPVAQHALVLSARWPGQARSS